MDISTMRKEYVRIGLSEEDLAPEPFQQFSTWFEQALAGGIEEPNAMSLGTVAASGQPSQRTVLLKYFDEQGFVFFTNYESRKAQEIDANAQVSVLFPWYGLERQVIVLGRAEKVSTMESVKYFLSRPKGSQLGAWVSNQSSVITSRSILLAKFEELKEQFHNKEIPHPAHWGGFRIIPHHIEFWQGRENRLHDRFVYSLQADGSWIVNRLAP
ncbi:MAG: pyridoxamine 5'-phosphate oxidase [Haliscomenobacter sp.]